MNTYPYIGFSETAKSTVLFYDERSGTYLKEGLWAGEKGKYYKCICDDSFKNTTREYLANTYGEVKSKEHAEFIVKLAEGAGFDVQWGGSVYFPWFSFLDKTLDFYNHERTACRDNEKLITIPLPHKEPEPKEWPQVGDEVVYDGSKDRFELIKGDAVKVIAKYSFEGSDCITIVHPYEGVFAMVVGTWLKKPLTPEEELAKEIKEMLSLTETAGKRVLLLMERYDIKKKPE